MSEGILVFDDVNPYTGMRGVLVKRAGEAVEPGQWLEKVPVASRGSLVVDRFELEQGKFVWHFLKLAWATRELIGFEAGDSRLAALGFKARVRVNPERAIPAAAWTMEAGPSSGSGFSDAIRCAAELYWGAIQRHPRFVLVRDPSPSPSPSLRDGEGSELKIIQADWVWRKMVIVL